MKSGTPRKTRRGVLKLVGGSLFATGMTGVASASQPAERESYRSTFDTKRDGIDRGEDRATVYFSGVATGTHIGEGTVEHHHTTILDGDRRFIDGEYEITAENGDLLKGTYHGDTKDATPPSRKKATGEWEHTGGTGKFGGVSGSGRTHGVANLNNGTIEMHFLGTISF